MGRLSDNIEQPASLFFFKIKRASSVPISAVIDTGVNNNLIMTIAGEFTKFSLQRKALYVTLNLRR